MKVTVNIDCTPQEARAFFGLPDVTAMNGMVMSKMQERAEENIETLSDPQKYFDKVMSMSGSNMENMQAAFAAMMAGMTPKND